MSKARIAVIGVGWWGTVGHLKHLVKDARAEVVAVWSRTEAKARARADEFGVPAAYTDVAQLLDECRPDGVVIATTPNVHYAQARMALERGVHVLMEKPFVIRGEDAVALDRLAEEKGCMLTVCHPVLYTGLMQEARDVVRSGALGDIVLVHSTFSQRTYDLYRGDADDVFDGRPGVPRPNATSYSDPAVVGGGEGHTQASHLVGTLLWITGLRPTEVTAAMNPLDTQVDVVDAMTVRFDGGAVGALSANGMVPRGIRAHRLLVQGSGGMLSLDISENTGWYQTDPAQPPTMLGTSDDALGAGGDRTARVPRNFVRAILGLEELYVPRWVAIDEARLLCAAYEAAESGRATPLA